MIVPPHIQQFNHRIKQMNQQRSTGLTLTVSEARNLHCEVFSLIAKIAELQDQLLQKPATAAVNDGGQW